MPDGAGAIEAEVDGALQGGERKPAGRGVQDSGGAGDGELGLRHQGGRRGEVLESRHHAAAAAELLERAVHQRAGHAARRHQEMVELEVGLERERALLLGRGASRRADERMIGAHHDDERRGGQGALLQRAGDEEVGEEGEIGGAVLEAAREVHVGALRDEGDAGRLGGDGGEQRREGEELGEVVAEEDEAALALRRHEGRAGADGVAQLGQGAGERLGEGLGARGEQQQRAAGDEQRIVEALAQPGQLLAGRALRDAEAAGGAGDVALDEEDVEGAQQIEIVGQVGHGAGIRERNDGYFDK